MWRKVSNGKRIYRNFGQYAEQRLRYDLTGKIFRHDGVTYSEGSDIPEFGLSVKSSRFSLMSAKLCKAQDFEGIISEYFQNTASHKVAYITQNMEAYLMNDQKFNEFLHKFATIDYDIVNGEKRKKVRCRKETPAMINWLIENLD